MDIIWSGHLVGTFHGYKPDRIYGLSDGSKWTQEDLTDEPVYRDDPPARLLFSGSSGAIYLDVEGTSAVVRVHRTGSRPSRPLGLSELQFLMKSRHPVVLLFVGSASAAEYPTRVIGITDGDTLTVLTAQKTQVKIRLAGIDAPESGQDFGTRAKQAASELAFGKTVTIIERDKNRYGRTVVDVWLPSGRSLSRALVRSGLAWWYRKYADDDMPPTRQTGSETNGR
jgi:endonuclease YncB( thermonuclease family)